MGCHESDAATTIVHESGSCLIEMNPPIQMRSIWVFDELVLTHECAIPCLGVFVQLAGCGVVLSGLMIPSGAGDAGHRECGPNKWLSASVDTYWRQMCFLI